MFTLPLITLICIYFFYSKHNKNYFGSIKFLISVYIVMGIVALLLTMFGGETGQVIGTILNQTQGTTQSSEQVQTRELTQEEVTLGQFSEAVFV